MAKKVAKIAAKTAEKPKRLSKAGEWLRDNPKGLGVVIHDMRAVMR
jgi:hypothetical protein